MLSVRCSRIWNAWPSTSSAPRIRAAAAPYTSTIAGCNGSAAWVVTAMPSTTAARRGSAFFVTDGPGSNDEAAPVGRLLDVLQQRGLGLRSHELERVADHGLRDRGDVVALGEVRVTGDLDAVGGDLVALQRESEGQADRPGTVRSSGRREHLEVDVPLQGGQGLPGCRGKPAVALRYVHDRVDQGAELVAGRQSVEPDAVVLRGPQDGDRRDPSDPEALGLFLVQDEVAVFDREAVVE